MYIQIIWVFIGLIVALFLTAYMTHKSSIAIAPAFLLILLGVLFINQGIDITQDCNGISNQTCQYNLVLSNTTLTYSQLSDSQLHETQEETANTYALQCYESTDKGCLTTTTKDNFTKSLAWALIFVGIGIMLLIGYDMASGNKDD